MNHVTADLPRFIDEFYNLFQNHGLRRSAMSLKYLYHHHDKMCVQLANEAKSAEIRQQWLQLAGQWRQKAEADERGEAPPPTVQATARLRRDVPTPDVNAPPTRPSAPEVSKRELTSILPNANELSSPAPASTEEFALPPINTSSHECFSQEGTDQTEIGDPADDLWRRLIAEIRARG